MVFSPGNPTQCSTVDTISDGVSEPDEMFFVSAVPVGDQIIIPDDNSDVIITDNRRFKIYIPYLWICPSVRATLLLCML